MGQLTITGHSDDIISVEGDVVDEFDAIDGEGHVAISDGSVVRFTYDAGIWRFSAVKVGEGTEATFTPCSDPTGDDEYTDTVTMTRKGHFDWAACGEIAHRRK